MLEPDPQPRQPPQPPPRGQELICSAKACRATATNALLWNNPSLHTPARRKVWLACAEHTLTLADFLSLRGFLRETVSADDIPAGAG